MVRFVNFRASDIQPNPDEVMYWVDLSTDPLGGSIKVWNAEGYWETIKVLQGTLPEFENRIKKWVEQQLKNFDEHLNEEIRQFDGRIAIISQDIETLKLTKQDKLIAGSGIDITDNVVSCVLDLTLYKIVSELPTEDIDTTKIYLVVDSEGEQGNLYKEYIYVDGDWELLGEYKADIDLSPYLTKVEAADTYATKLELQQEVTRATQAEITEKNRALAAEEQLSKDIDAEKDRALIAERDNFNRIINEIARAEAAEKANAKAIEDEATRAIEIESALAQGLVGEESRAIEAEKQIQGEVWALDTKVSEQGESLNESITSNAKAIADETTRATQAEGANRNLINAMDTAYKAADTATNTKLNEEVTRAKAAEKTNADNITAEKTRNDAQDTLISGLQTSKVSTVTLVKDPNNELHYTLMVDSTNAGEISIPKDRFLKEAYYDPQKKSLIFVFVTADGEQTVPVDISDLVDTYTAGNGLNLTNNKFSVAIDSTSDSYLTVGANGIKLSGVATAINNIDTAYKAADTANLNAAKVYTDAESTARQAAVTQLQTNIDAEETRATRVEDRLNGQIFALDAAKQERLVSGETIKTVNGSSLLGSGNITIQGGGSGGIEDAPSDNKEYTRKNKAWAALPIRSVSPEANSLVQRDSTGNILMDKKAIYFNNNMNWWMQVNSDGNFILNSTGNANKFLYYDNEVATLNNLYVLKETIIDTTSLDQATYYPVTIQLAASYNSRLEVHAALYISGKPEWSTHGNGFTTHFIEEIYGSGWGANYTTHRRIIDHQFKYTDSVQPIGKVSQMGNASIEVIWVRGGAIYYFETTKNATPVLRTSEYTSSNETVGPKAASDMTNSDYSTLKRTIVETSDVSDSYVVDKIVKRSTSGNIFVNYVNTAMPRSDEHVIDDVLYMSAQDGYIRRSSMSRFKSQISGTGLDADTLDGQQDTAYLRNRGITNPSAEDKDPLWNLIGIRQYDATLPPDLTGPYNYGAIVSLPSNSARLELFYSHHSSNGSYTDATKTGIYYRTGWDNAKMSWAKFIDSNNVDAANTANKIPVRDANKQILTSGYKKEGSDASYLLTGDGGHISKQVEAVASTVVQRDGSGTIYAKTFVSSLGDAEGMTIGSVFVRNTTDDVLRRVSFANFKTALAIPTSLKNPYAIKFTGAATGTYDGSATVTLNIPTIAGPTGATGATGAKGADGITPTIGANGNWYLGSTDTGKPSRGATGAQGAAGAKGEKGDKGDKGDTGAQGPQGLKGDTGARGATGPAGANGITPLLRPGSDGDWKVSYDNGATYNWVKDENNNYCPSRGEKGEKGDTGPQGPQGATGPAGTTTWSGITGKPSWIGTSKPTYTWSEITSKPSWIGSSKPTYTWSEITSKPTFATVATSGSYNDLSNKPVIDSTISSTSTNAVQNKVIYSKLSEVSDSIADVASTILSSALQRMTQSQYDSLSSKNPGTLYIIIG